MERFYQLYHFYKKPLLIVSILNLIFSVVFTTHFEEYEGIFSSFVQGIYTTPSIKEWNVDVHFFLYGFYAYINQYFPTIQVYGIILLIYNFVSLTFIGFILYRILRINLNNESLWVFIMLYSILSIDNIVNLSTNRIAFVLLAATFGFIESSINQHKKISKIKTIFILCVMLFVSLLRFDFAILASLIYLLLAILHRRFNRFIFISFFVSISITLLYNFIMMNYMSEARQIYYYKELDFVMRNNYDYKQFTNLQTLEVNAFYHAIFDKVHMTWDFYNSISLRGKDKGFFSLFYGLNTYAFINTFKKSVVEYEAAWYFILFSITSALFLIKKQTGKRLFWITHLIITILFPTLVCFYVVTPLRFLVPYYSILGVFYLCIYLYYFKLDNYVSILSALALIVIAFYAFAAKKNYHQKDEVIINSIKKIEALNVTQNYKLPIIINNFDPTKFFPENPYLQIKKQNVLFLNLYYFMSYDCYIDKWNEACNCDALSLKDKVDYIIAKEALFIIDNSTLEFMINYFKMKYNKNLIANKIEAFDKELNIYKLNYE